MSRVHVQIMNQFHRKSHEYKAIKRYWKLIQQDSRKLSDKRFYRPIFCMHLTNKEILNKLLSYSEDLKHHYQLYQLLLFHFQNKEPEKFFGLIEDNLKQVHPIFQTVFKTFLKDKEKIVNALQLHYSNAKLEAQHLSRAMSRVRVQIMNQFHRKSHEYKAIKRYWKLIQQDSRKLSDKRFYRPTFRIHLTNKEILNKLLSYSEDLKHHYQLYQLLLFHFQNKEPEKFFGLIEDNLKQVHPIFQTVFKTFLKDKEKIVNALQLPYSNAKLEATNNLIKLIKRNAFGFRNFENFKKRIFIALNIKKERTKFVLSRA
ncbi:transposase [Streptococcus pneumoniae]|nr:transposase [Streptococcus pneumoniae]